MKFKLILFVFFLMQASLSMAQNSKSSSGIKPYIAIVKTKGNKIRGLFFKIDSQKVLLYAKDKYIGINTSDIKSIKLRVTKPGYELQSYILKYAEKKDPNKYRYTNQQGKSVDKWGNEAPTPNEEVGTAVAQVIFGTALEGVANVVAGSLHHINPSVAHYKFKAGFDLNQLETINYYTVYYQQNPNTIAELKKLKELSANFKP